MKKQFIALSLALFTGILSAQVGVGTSTPNASAILDVESTNKGFLPPRMTQAQRNAIVSPATGLVVFCSNCGTKGELQVYLVDEWTNILGGAAAIIDPWPIGTVHCGDQTVVVDVTNPTTGKIWMDRNLGASQAATSSTDANSYGDLYQWGRGADGHQCRNSTTTATLSTTDQPGNGNFITITLAPYDWRSPQNDNLWQGVNGVNNPCPSGYRLPSYAELEAERLSWSSNNAAGAFASPLKLPAAGGRVRSNGSLLNVGSLGRYWSSSVSGTNARYLSFNSSDAGMLTFYRANGFSVRCLKD